MRLIGPSFVITLACLTTFAVISDAHAQISADVSDSHSDLKSQPAPATASYALPQPQPCPQPYTATIDHQKSGETEKGETTKALHLRRAAQHLMAAGKPVMARQIANEAKLEAKLQQIRELQAEVESLRSTMAANETVTLHVKIMELKIASMKRMGLDFQTADGAGTEEHLGGALVQLGAVDALIETLREHGLVKVLAEPTLVVVSGRPASFRSGGELPVVVPQSPGTSAVEYREFGTRLDCMAKVLDNGRIRLELRPAVTEIDNSRSVVVDETIVPGLRTRWVDTAVEMDAGQTMVLSGLRHVRSKPDDDSTGVEETALLVTVTADLSEPVAAADHGVASKRR